MHGDPIDLDRSRRGAGIQPQGRQIAVDLQWHRVFVPLAVVVHFERRLAAGVAAGMFAAGPEELPVAAGLRPHPQPDRKLAALERDGGRQVGISASRVDDQHTVRSVERALVLRSPTFVPRLEIPAFHRFAHVKRTWVGIRQGFC